MRTVEASLRRLQQEGYDCEKVERWIGFGGRQGAPSGGGVRRDLFGVGDILAIRPGEMLLVQTCSSKGYAEHVRKILAEPRALMWLRAGGMLRLEGWLVRKTKGNRARYEKVQQEYFAVDQFPAEREEVLDGESEERAALRSDGRGVEHVDPDGGAPKAGDLLAAGGGTA